MKLQNKKTGEIISFFEVFNYNSLSELIEEWEDMPEEPKEYWYISWCGNVAKDKYTGIPTDEKCKEIGNYFESKEEAEKAVEKLKAWKRLKDKGISFEAKVTDGKLYLEPKAEPQQRTFDEAHDLFEDIMFVFGGEE